MFLFSLPLGKISLERLVKQLMVCLPHNLTKPLMKEHCKYLQGEYKTISYSYFIRESSSVWEHQMWVMICRTHLGKRCQGLWKSHPLITGWGLFVFYLMTDISYRRQTWGKEACQTPDTVWTLTLTLPGQLAPVYLDYVAGLLLGSGVPYSPAKDTATPSHRAVDCLLSLMICILIRL